MEVTLEQHALPGLDNGRGYIAASSSLLEPPINEETREVVRVTEHAMLRHGITPFVASHHYPLGQRQGAEARALFWSIQNEVATRDLVFLIYAGPSQDSLIELMAGSFAMKPTLILLRDGAKLNELSWHLPPDLVTVSSYGDIPDASISADRYLTYEWPSLYSRAKLRSQRRKAAMKNDLGDTVRWLRRKRGWDIDELSRQSTVPSSVISMLETGNLPPEHVTLLLEKMLAIAFQVTLSDLLRSPSEWARHDALVVASGIAADRHWDSAKSRAFLDSYYFDIFLELTDDPDDPPTAEQIGKLMDSWEHVNEQDGTGSSSLANLD